MVHNQSHREVMPLTNGVFGASWTLPGRSVWRISKSVGVLGQPLLSDTVWTRRLELFGMHVARADKSQDHSRALQACISPAPRNSSRRPGRPRHTWIRTVEEDLRQFNLAYSGWFTHINGYPSAVGQVQGLYCAKSVNQRLHPRRSVSLSLPYILHAQVPNFLVTERNSFLSYWCAALNHHLLTRW